MTGMNTYHHSFSIKRIRRHEPEGPWYAAELLRQQPDCDLGSGSFVCFRSQGIRPWLTIAPPSPLQERDELEVRRQAAELERLRLDTGGRSAAGKGATAAGRGAGGALGEEEEDDEDDEGEEGL